MSDKETAPWMKEAAESIALAALRYRTFQMPTCIAEIIAAHCPVAVECTAPAPQPCGKNMGNDLLIIPCDLPRDHKGPCERNVWPVNAAIVPLDGRDSWTEEELANFGKLASQPQPVPTEHLIRAATTPQVTPTLKEILKQYGAHHIRDCDALNKWKKLPCDCGFAALIEGTSKQAPQELELEQETEGRWLAAYTRFPGVAAYGPSKEEAIWNAAKVLIDSEPADTIDDGFGNSWSAYCPTCKQKSMYVSRPGDARCSTCESKQSHEFKPYMEDHEYYDPPQASPTPLEEMCESAIDLAAELRVELRHAVMCMDRSCKQCNAIAKRCGEVERG